MSYPEEIEAMVNEIHEISEAIRESPSEFQMRWDAVVAIAAALISQDGGASSPESIAKRARMYAQALWDATETWD